MLDDDGIDDAEEKAANARPRRAVPERRPREPRDPSGSVLTPTGVFATRHLLENKNAPTPSASAADALTELEARVRLELRALHTAAKSAKDHVFEAFGRVDAFGAGVLSRDAFAEGLAALGAAVSAAEAAALCRAADPEGSGETVSCALFARRVLRGAARADADDADVCRGWPVTDEDFVSKKIVYPRCRSFVRAPGDLDASLIDRSMFPPDADLRLDHVYGYDGVACAAPNAFVTADPNKVVYCAAAVAVVHDSARDEQAHFRGHTRDVTCLTLCDAEVTVAGVTYPPRTLCATGQKVPSADAASYLDEGDVAAPEADARPFVAVWDVRTLREVARVPLSADARAVAGAAFSPDGTTLVTAGCDNNHTVQVWDWRVARVGEPRRRSGRTSEPFPGAPFAGRSKSLPAPVGSGSSLVGLLHENAGFKERPGAVFGLAFDPFALNRAGETSATAVRERFVSYGKKHVKCWTRSARTNEWVSKTMSFGSFKTRDVCSVAFLPPKRRGGEGTALGEIVTGHPDGSLLVWRGGAAFRAVEGAHGRGARSIQPDGAVAWGGGVGAMRLRFGATDAEGQERVSLVTGGADGALCQWAVVDGTLGGKITEPLALAKARSGVKEETTKAIDKRADKKAAFFIRAIDVVPGTDRVVVGASRCELWDVDLHPKRETARVLMRGHGASLRAVCWHPSDPDRLYTACASGAVRAWDAARRATIKKCVLAFAATSVAVGGDASAMSTHVAVGGEHGEVLVLAEPSFEVVFAAKDTKGTRTGVKSAPAGVEDLKFSPDGGSRLAVTYRDGRVEVFGRNRRAGERNGIEKAYEKIARFKGHSASARHVDWSADGAMLATCGADYEILRWDVPAARGDATRSDRFAGSVARQNLADQRDRRFATRTGVLGFPVMGVWPAGSDGTDVNALDVSPCGRYAVTADDGGFVKLFAYPALSENAPHRAYRGHAGHVASVRFNCDGTRVASAGGRDRCAFQFSVRRRPEPAPAVPPRPKRWLPLDASGKAFGFREPREEEDAAREDRDASPRRDGVLRPDDATYEKFDEDIEVSLEDRGADLPVFVPRREDVFAGVGGARRGDEGDASLAELDANAAPSVDEKKSHPSFGSDVKASGKSPAANEGSRGWRPLRRLVTTIAAFGSPSRKARDERDAAPSGDSSPAPSARARPDSDSEPEIDEAVGEGGYSSEEVLEEIEA